MTNEAPDRPADRRPFYAMLLLAGLCVPLLVALSPAAYVRIASTDVSPLPFGLLDHSYSMAFLLVGIASVAALARRRVHHLRVPAPKKIFFVLLVSGFYFSILPGPYVGILLVLYYVLLFLGSFAGIDFRLRFTPIHWWMLAYLAACALSLQVLTRGGSPFQITVLLQPFARFLSVLFIVNFLRDRDDFEFAAKTFIAIGAITVLVAIYQVAMYSFTGKVTSLMSTQEGARRFFSLGGLHFLRATGLFKHPAYLGQVCAFGALFPLAALALPQRDRRTTIKLLAVVAWMLIGLFCSFSRASWLAVMVSALIVPPLLKPNWAVRYILFISITGLLFVLAGGLGAGIDYMIEAKSSSVNYRVEIMRLGFDAFARSPWFGTGLQSFRYYPGNIQSMHVHNTFMMAFTELGLVGGTLIILLYVHGMNRAIRNLFMALDPFDRNLAVVLFVALILSLIMQQFEQALNFHINYFLLGSIEAMTIYLRQKQGENITAKLRRDELIRGLPHTRWA
ncbi:MAG: hypothetical protein CME06_16230 [Gemmatimonadetes bacterium]|nr:hypothetical protein [Gemmatimonadota bacterium]